MKYLPLFLFTIITACFAQPKGWPVNQILDQNTYKVSGFDGHGTGFSALTASNKTVIITNWHVCQLAWKGKITVKSDWYGAEILARVIKEDPVHDLCALESVIKTDGIKLATAASFGTALWSAGYHGLRSTITHTQGFIISLTDTQLDYSYPKDKTCPPGFLPRAHNYDKCTLKIRLTDTTMSGAPGASGSPVVNSKGLLVGVVNSVNNKTLSMIPLEDVKRFLESL